MGKPQQDPCIRGTLQEDQASQRTHTEHGPTGIKQCRNRGDEQQDQADYPQVIWLPEYAEHDGHGVTCMLENKGSTSQ